MTRQLGQRPIELLVCIWPQCIYAFCRVHINQDGRQEARWTFPKSSPSSCFMVRGSLQCSTKSGCSRQYCRKMVLVFDYWRYIYIHHEGNVQLKKILPLYARFHHKSPFGWVKLKSPAFSNPRDDGETDKAWHKMDEVWVWDLGVCIHHPFHIDDTLAFAKSMELPALCAVIKSGVVP